MQDNFKKQLEVLSKQQGNEKCFDCENIPAHWASVNNGIYLCMDCSGEHRGFGVQNSFIKSIVLDNWTQDQVNLMRAGGNEKLANFLKQNNMPSDTTKKAIYCSNLMAYYRRQLKADSNGELFMEPLPAEGTFWYEAEGNNTSNNSMNYNIFNSNNNNNNLIDFNTIYSNKNQNSNNAFDLKYPKSEIIINDDQYKEARNQAELASKLNGSSSSEPCFKSFSAVQKNDPKYGSVGSEPFPISSTNDNSFAGSGYFGTLGNMIGTVWNASCTVASGIKNKMNEYEVGSKLMYVGGKAVQAITYAGGKVIETGNDFIHSETAANIASKAGEGLGYIKNKITGTSDSSSESRNALAGGSYSSTSSDDYSKY